jgi:NAD-dependent dihydropyrimidine dehydrogenase PreA subunit
VIVNVPKLKTHCLVGMTGAVKNMFGCIPGKLKTGHHLAQPDRIEFSEMLLALHDTITPHLTVVDGVIGMEGPGPGAGDPRSFGVIVAGPSSIAVDTVCARILGFAGQEVSTVWLAQKRGIPEASLGNIEVRGEPIGEVAVTNLKKPRISLTSRLPRPLMNLGKRLLTPGPAVLQDRCLLCGDCLRICSARAVSLTGHGPRFDSRSCIRCYCCHEICPASAITLKGWFER